MARKINYTQMMDGERIHLSVSSNNEKDYQEQLSTVQTYCDDYSIEEVAEELTLEQQVTDLQLAITELFERMVNNG